jgi:single-strand DNA-binding protein
MSASLNKVLLIGHVVRDPEIRYIPSGTAVTKFAVAVNGRKEDDVIYPNVIAWDKLAEATNKYLTKGSKVLVEGRLTLRSYEKDGTKHYVTEIVANNVQFLGSPKGAAVAAPAAEQAAELAEEVPF